ncbi:MAG: VOC family protein [Bryobacteraceae bacterium]|nr:VOC family protein [Bryobacteraceae bacterium]
MPGVDDSLGAPCWFELGTTDQNAAKQFYTQLLGWRVTDSEMGEDRVYSIFRLKDADVGGAYALAPEQQAQGVSPHWMAYFAATNADETAAKAAQLGGSVIMEPFDVRDLGRMAVCRDPGGAVFGLWQAKRHKGVGVYGEKNSVCWTELATRDTSEAREFYNLLFGWETRTNVNMPTYVEYGIGGEFRGGLLQMDEEWEGVPPHWGIYFLVDDCDGTAARARMLGGKTRQGPFDAPGVGRIAMMADPQGAAFYVITLNM